MWIKLLEVINRWIDNKLSKIYRYRFYDDVKKYLIDKNIPFVIEDKSHECPTIFITVLQKDYEYVHGLTAWKKKGSVLEWTGYGLNICTEETVNNHALKGCGL